MAMIDSFRCSACGYAACVSGGADALMLAYTRTICCLECRELSDACVGVRGDTRKVRPRCNVNPAHRVRVWNAGGPCPRCGAPMRERRPMALAD